ncbi:uncharacterized protein LOC106659572 [Trichogramma pretiosum]|uniref:uncharacterized protein LOC106659572 n=1 Tax=Trichogramma pretiosum TaxID=7493 RepID=UPI0006C9C220|nr:uncharacterized protein LOC106659572 [Trichogramma pretiosum]
MFTSIRKSVALLSLIYSHREPQARSIFFFGIKMAAKRRGMQEANEERYSDASLVNDETNDLPRARRSIQEGESETDGGDAATNNPSIQIRSGRLLIEDKDAEKDDYPARDNPPPERRRRSFQTNEPAQSRNNSGLVLIEDVEPESDGYQPLTIEEIDLEKNDPAYNPMLDEDSSDANLYDVYRMLADIERRLQPALPPLENEPRVNGDLNNLNDPQLVQPRPIPANAIDWGLLGDEPRDGENVLDYFIRHVVERGSESEIENDSETERHERRGPLEAERHFYDCTLRSITNKIRMAAVKAVTHDPDQARSLAFREACERALAIYENARPQPLQDN